MDVTSQTLGIRTIGGFMDPLIPRNTPIPHEICKTYHTTNDDQTQVRVEIYQGASQKAESNHLLGEFVLTGLRPAPRGEMQVRISFAIDADGIVKVSAEDMESGNQIDMMVRATSRMGSEELSHIRQTADRAREEARKTDSDDDEALSVPWNTEEDAPPLQHDAEGTNPFQEESLDVATETAGISFVEADDDLDLSQDWLDD